MSDTRVTGLIIEKETPQQVYYEGSWGSTKPTTRTMKFKVELPFETPAQGWFEMWDVETKGNRAYGSGGLWFNRDKELVDYDGVSSLSSVIIEMIAEAGFDVEEMRESLA